MAGLATLTADYSYSDEEHTEQEPSSENKIVDLDEYETTTAATTAAAAAAAQSDASKASSSVPPHLRSKESSMTPKSGIDSSKSTPVKRSLVSYQGADDDDSSDSGSDSGDDARDSPSKKPKISGSDDDAPRKKNDEDTNLEDLTRDQGQVVPMDLESDEEDENRSQEGGGDAPKEAQTSKEDVDAANKEDDNEDEDLDSSRRSGVSVEAWTGGVQLPPEPPGRCDPELQKKFTAMAEKRKAGYDLNSVIQRGKRFRNPSIYEKLIQFCEIDEHGTNFPKELYDGHLFGKESYYEELGKVQAADMERREKAAKARAASSGSSSGQQPKLTSAADKKAAEESQQQPKRKSRFDQGGTAQVHVPAPLVLGQGAGSAKTISAFGPLKK